MAENNRIFYGIHQVGIRKDGNNSFLNENGEIIRGVQIVVMATNFNLDQLFKLGKL